jgi:sialidase-1
MKRYFIPFLAATFISLTGCNPDVNLSETLDANLIQHTIPLLKERENPNALEITLSVPDSLETLSLKSAITYFSENTHFEMIDTVFCSHVIRSGEESIITPLGKSGKISEKVKFTAPADLVPGQQSITFGFKVKNETRLDQSFSIEKIELLFAHNKKLILQPEESCSYRPGLVLRAAGQDNCDTYRIPGIITTSKGTLIAVYDNRYNNSKDLQEDVDIGMSRSTDGGETWEPMQVIMDMGEWGGRPDRLNGIGDPSVLYDPNTGTIWVAALWMSGSAPDQMLWWASQPGMSPEETGQFILAKSTDDGLTWSEPINITAQIKDPAWQLLLQGPGAGITMKDGTLVFPAQFKADTGEKALDGGQYTCHSTIIYSKDGGQTWQIGTGAKSNTTEAQVVELADGSLMLNMRDDRNRKDKGETNGRAVAVTTDLGKTWTTHPSSNSALPEPNCMASIISFDRTIGGQQQQVLLFSNPNNKNRRTNMTIKASVDGGHTWPENYQVELFAPAGYGYSCLTMVDDKTVGILYEGVKELYFQKIPVNEILK